MKKLEVGKDYKHKRDNNLICIDRKEEALNLGFVCGGFVYAVVCSNPSEWEEATEEEVVAAFEKECVRRFGDDWKNIKLSKKAIGGYELNRINVEEWQVEILKHADEDLKGWMVWNHNGVLYYNGRWNKELKKSEFKKGDWLIVDNCEEPLADLVVDVTEKYYVTRRALTDESVVGFSKNIPTLRLATQEEILKAELKEEPLIPTNWRLLENTGNYIEEHLANTKVGFYRIIVKGETVTRMEGTLKEVLEEAERLALLPEYSGKKIVISEDVKAFKIITTYDKELIEVSDLEDELPF